MDEQKMFSVKDIEEMPNVASVLEEKFAGGLKEAWKNMEALDGKELKTLNGTVKLYTDECGIHYDDELGSSSFYTTTISLNFACFEIFATNMPYHPQIPYEDLISICDSDLVCIGATSHTSTMIRKMGYNLGQTVISVISLFYGLVYAVLK